MKDGRKCGAIVLAAGTGKRMGGNVPKQFMTVKGRPLLYYALKTFQESFIDEIVIVTKSENFEYVKKDIVEEFCFTKVIKLTEGGRERYHSVLKGLEALEDSGCDYVFIHDGARPFITHDILLNAYEGVAAHHVAIASVPSKDTVKLADEDGFVTDTPNRNSVYIMQTPQTFEYKEILDCYRKLAHAEEDLLKSGVAITDDAMVMERFGNRKVYLTKGDYRNIKVTTPEDLRIADLYVEDMNLC